MRKQMDERSIGLYISETFDGVDTVEASGDWYFSYDPGRDLEPHRRFPFATLVTSDQYDNFSDLNRPGVFRLNIGVSRETFASLFGAARFPDDPAEVAATGYDFTALDTFLPHPVYGRMHWISVLNPSDATFERVMAYLAEAYDRAVERLHRWRPADET
jgi:hypothetical protein